jgi:phenylacetate-CoA ligase
VDLSGFFLRKIVYPAFVALKRESHLSWLQELERTQYLPPEKLELLQFERLRKLVQHASLHCPFYARRFSEFGVSLATLKEPGDVKKFPVLKKKDIQTGWKDMVATCYTRSQLMENRTGGSTGKPLLFYVDLERMESRKAATLRHNRWAGYDIADKAGIIWGATRDIASFLEGKTPPRSMLFERALVLDASSMTETNMLAFARRLVKYGPKVVLGYSNSIFLFATFLEQKGVEKSSPRTVITTAEMLYPHQREKIERVFGCAVYDRYGSRETSVIASECDRHTGLHVNGECLLVETLRDGKKTAPGEAGDVVITDLLNFGMPLIRYDIEDRASFSGGHCSCGRTLPLLAGIEGRATDFIRTPDGRYVSGAALTIRLVAEIPGLAQAQIVQRELGAVTFRLVKGADFTKESEELLLRKSRELMGEEMRIFLDFVAEIPSEPSGKFRFSISEL